MQTTRESDINSDGRALSHHRIGARLEVGAGDKTMQIDWKNRARIGGDVPYLWGNDGPLEKERSCADRCSHSLPHPTGLVERAASGHTADGHNSRGQDGAVI